MGRGGFSVRVDVERDVELFLSRDRGGDKIRSSHVMMCTKDFRIFKQLLFFTRFRMYRSA